MSHTPILTGVVEGFADEAALRKIAATLGLSVDPLLKIGKKTLRARIAHYNQAALRSRWVVLVDLDHDDRDTCIVSARDQWLAQPARWMCFRLVVRALECWLMADPENLAAFLDIAQKHIPRQPELVDFPKRQMVDLARKSTKKAIRADMIPRENAGREEGPAYATRLAEFAAQFWDVSTASQNAPSLAKCIACLRKLSELQLDHETENLS